MKEIPIDDFKKGKILFAIKTNGENMTKHIVVWYSAARLQYCISQYCHGMKHMVDT